MANTKQYLSHLLQNTGITPACSEEEREAANVIAKIFADHGFTPEMQEFSASGMTKVAQAILSIVAFVGAVLCGIGGALGVVGLLLALAAAVVYVLERTGRPVISGLGSGGLSQNVIAYHRASGPLASPRNRPVVVVAHYDSPREDLLAREPFAAYKPLIVKLLPFAMVAPAVLAFIRLFPVPGAAKAVLWVLAILAALVPLANGVAIIANRFVLPYTTGAVSNKSSVAAMLGVMDAVSPYELGEEFPHDTPADEYFAEQQRILEDAIAAAEAAAAAEAEAAMAYPHEVEGQDEQNGEADEVTETAEVGKVVEQVPEVPVVLEPVDVLGATATDLPAVDLGTTVTMNVENDVAPAEDEVEEQLDADATVATMPAIDSAPVVEEDLESEEEDLGAGTQSELDLDAAAPEPKLPFYLNSAGNVRFGADVIRGLGMLPESCVVLYEPGDEPEPETPTAFEVEHEEEAPAADAYDAYDTYDEDVELEQDYSEEDTNDESELAEAYDEAEDEDGFEEAFAPQEEVEEEDDFDVVMEAEYEVIEDEAEDEAAEETAMAASDETPSEDGNAAIDAAAEEAPAGQPVEEEHHVEEDHEDQDAAGATEVFAMPSATPRGEADMSGTIAMPVQPSVQPVETVDSLMAQIDSAVPARPKRTISVPSTADAPVPRVPQTANRASLFDLPDPSAAPADPFGVQGVPNVPNQSGTADVASEARSAFTVISSPEPVAAPEQSFETISAPAPAQEKPHRGIGRLFGRKRKNDDSMSEWLGVDDSFDAKSTGNDIGSWDNFDDGWKGGAAGYDGATEEELREAVADMGDDELLGHDIWFVATGASENGNAGIRAFLDAHRDKLRGVFLINLESVGAGQLAMLATEGEQRVFKGDKRIMKLVQQVSSDFHRECATVDMPYVTTDAHVAMGMSLRSLTIGGVEGTGFALAHTEEDQPYNVDTDNVAFVSDVVTEVIRRS